ncbi:hypothetical protein GCM10022246_00230 [Pedobacter ginsengiterrae]|uniref:4-hydroxybenzoate polyprenyltransferase n=1 Tax=Pedobacter ginsengiterrae TaxID=871696 RepID=A0ABP7NP36_9SPHI|nr:UbiA family prenyltransferase [Pedobacter aquatilis]
MKIFNVIRSHEWWAYKLPPLLAIGYATTIMTDTPLYKVALWLIFLLCSLIIGAIYVSVINDITDMDEDIASGKSNRIQHLPKQYRWIIPAICILLGIFFGYFLYPDVLSCFLYSLSWIVFSLYSIKPFRLKNRGILGVIADGCGSHLFPSLLMVSSMSYVSNQQIDYIWFAAVGIWALAYGLRGILWHQFSDRENDIKVNLNTYASGVEPTEFNNKARFIFIVEIFALTIMLLKIHLIITIVALIFYFILIFLRYKINKTQVIIVLKSDDRPYQIIMADYYQMFLPISLLFAAILINIINVTVLIIHISLFPYLLWLAIYDYAFFARAIVFKKHRNF